VHTDWFLLCTDLIRNWFIPHSCYLPYSCDDIYSPTLSVCDWDHHIAHLRVLQEDKER